MEDFLITFIFSIIGGILGSVCMDQYLSKRKPKKISKFPKRSWKRFGICSHGMYLGTLSIWWWDAWERRFILSFATAHRHLHFFPFFYEERWPCMIRDAIESAAEELAEEMRGDHIRTEQYYMDLGENILKEMGFDLSADKKG